MTSARRASSYTRTTSEFVPQDIVPLDALKSDTINLNVAMRGIRAVVAGNVKIKTAAGQDRTIPILAGETRWIAFTRVFATGTTATGLEGLV